ncbi:DUF5915 domain-containing protein, partial [Vibrio parahaemolyticus]
VATVTTDVDAYVTTRLKPSFRSLGQKGMGKQAQELKKSMASLASAEAQAILATILAEGQATVSGVALTRDDVEVAFDAKEGYAAAGDRVGV